MEKFKQHHLTIEVEWGASKQLKVGTVRTKCMVTSAAGARTMLMYHGNTLVIANAIQSERLGTEKTMLFTWSCRCAATPASALNTRNSWDAVAYLTERSTDLRPVVQEPYLHKRPVPHIVILVFIRDVPRRALLPIPDSELRARREELGDAGPAPADGGPVQRCATVVVRRVRIRAVSEEHAHRNFVALARGPVQCRAALAIAFVG